jgi:hypothetical protein
MASLVLFASSIYILSEDLYLARGSACSGTVCSGRPNGLASSFERGSARRCPVPAVSGLGVVGPRGRGAGWPDGSACTLRRASIAIRGGNAGVLHADARIGSCGRIEDLEAQGAGYYPQAMGREQLSWFSAAGQS